MEPEMDLERYADELALEAFHSPVYEQVYERRIFTLRYNDNTGLTEVGFCLGVT